MTARRLHHVQIAIPTGGEVDARRFFGDLVGLPEIPKPPNLSVRGGLWFQIGEEQLHLGIESEFHAAHKAHPAIEIDDLQSLRARLSSAGVETWEDEPLHGYVRFYARDPFGNRIEFLELAP